MPLQTNFFFTKRKAIYLRKKIIGLISEKWWCFPLVFQIWYMIRPHLVKVVTNCGNYLKPPIRLHFEATENVLLIKKKKKNKWNPLKEQWESNILIMAFKNGLLWLYLCLENGNLISTRCLWRQLMWLRNRFYSKVIAAKGIQFHIKNWA